MGSGGGGAESGWSAASPPLAGSPPALRCQRVYAAETGPHNYLQTSAGVDRRSAAGAEGGPQPAAVSRQTSSRRRRRPQLTWPVTRVPPAAVTSHRRTVDEALARESAPGPWTARPGTRPSRGGVGPARHT